MNMTRSIQQLYRKSIPAMDDGWFILLDSKFLFDTFIECHHLHSSVDNSSFAPVACIIYERTQCKSRANLHFECTLLNFRAGSRVSALSISPVLSLSLTGERSRQMKRATSTRPMPSGFSICFVRWMDARAVSSLFPHKRYPPLLFLFFLSFLASKMFPRGPIHLSIVWVKRPAKCDTEMCGFFAPILCTFTLHLTHYFETLTSGGKNVKWLSIIHPETCLFPNFVMPTLLEKHECPLTVYSGEIRPSVFVVVFRCYHPFHFSNTIIYSSSARFCARLHVLYGFSCSICDAFSASACPNSSDLCIMARLCLAES